MHKKKIDCFTTCGTEDLDRDNVISYSLAIKYGRGLLYENSISLPGIVAMMELEDVDKTDRPLMAQLITSYLEGAIIGMNKTLRKSHA